MRIPTNHVTVANYLDFTEDSFLIQKAKRYDVKGKRYFDSPSKYYAADTGIRNIHIAQRQSESTLLMENVIFNELTRRGYNRELSRHKRYGSKNGHPFGRRPNIAVCRTSASAAEAAKKLFAVSRRAKTTVNDSDRLTKFLARFGLKFKEIAHP